MIKLYSNLASYYSCIARLALAESKIDYQLENIDIHNNLEQLAPAFASIQPTMSVPALIDGDQMFASSEAIMRHCAELNPSVDLYPQSKQLEIDKLIKAHYQFSIEELTLGTLLRKSPFIKIVMKHAIKRAIKRCEKNANKYPALTTTYQTKIALNKERLKLIFSPANNYTDIVQQRDHIYHMLDQQLEQYSFIAADHYTLADIPWTVFLARMKMLKADDLWSKNMSNYYQKVSARESFKSSLIITKMPLKSILNLLVTLFK